MSIDYNGKGTIVVKETKDFPLAAISLLKKYDPSASFMLSRGGVFKFMFYGRHEFIEEFNHLMENHMDSIVHGQIWYTTTEDSVPFEIFVEIAQGEITTQSLNKKLPCEWLSLVDVEWDDIREILVKEEPKNSNNDKDTFLKDII